MEPVRSEEELRNYYHGKIEELLTLLKRLRRRKSSFGWLRLGPVAAIIAVFFAFAQAGILFVSVLAIIFLIVFVRLVYADLSYAGKIRFAEKKLRLYEKEVQALDGGFPFHNGSQYLDKEHPYSADLDIFGEESLFQYLNRTTSGPGSVKLASWLSARSPIETIFERQAAIAELKTKEEWIKEMQTFGSLNGFTNESEAKLAEWMSRPAPFQPYWRWLRYLLPFISIATLALYFSGVINVPSLIAVFLLMAIISWRLDKVIAPIHRQLDAVAPELSSIVHQLILTESEKFNSPMLRDLQSRITANVTRASAEVRHLRKILGRLDLRYNIMVSIPLNLLIFWNLQQVLSLEKWKNKNRRHLFEWIEVIAEFDALNSLAIFSFNHPGYMFPKVEEGYFRLEAENMGHPLISRNKRVNNPAHLPGRGKVMLVTGSNMAGKSTYLRSVGVNCVLSFCGAAVCATHFRVSHVRLMTSMRIADNLQESTSTFYAELKKLKSIIDRVNAGDAILALLDEMLRGTNSHDRHTGSRALISQLIRRRSAAIVATHDLELAMMEEQFGDDIINYHFDVQVSDDELYFDYRLKPGICRSMNASILMKKIGIEI